MKPLGRILALALAAAVLLPGVVVGLSVCTMAQCPAMTAAGHDCCPPDGFEISAACCGPNVQVASSPAKATERFEEVESSLTSGFWSLISESPLARPLASASEPPRPLDSLALTCLLRI